MSEPSETKTDNEYSTYDPYNGTNEPESSYIELNSPQSRSIQIIDISSKNFKKLYEQARKLSRDHGVQISIPELVFCGFQSAGKTSAVAQATQMIVGIMKDGTGSRCPVRFIIKNKDIESIYCGIEGKNKQRCKNEDELMSIVLKYGNELTKTNKFDSSIFEAEITGKERFDITIIDCPGLIKSEPKNKKDENLKIYVEKMQAKFINEVDSNRNYKYIPVLVRKCVDMKLENKEDVQYINEIINKYPFYLNNIKYVRHDWLDDAIIIANQFDRQCNVATAKELCNYIYNIKDAFKDQNIVIASMNAGGQQTASLKVNELKQHIQSRISTENVFLNELCKTFEMDKDIDELKSKLKQNVGINLMKNIIDIKIDSIVKQITNDIIYKMDQRGNELNNKLNDIELKLINSNPVKLKSDIVTFNTKLLYYLEQYYKGALSAEISELYPEISQTWPEQMDKFKNSIHYKNCPNLQKWWQDHYVAPKILKKTVKKCENKKLFRIIDKKLVGSAKYERTIQCFEAMIAFIKFPVYTDEEILNFCDHHYNTREGSVYSVIKNYLMNAVRGTLKNGLIFLSQTTLNLMLSDMEYIYKYTVKQVFGDMNDFNTKNMHKLIKTGFNMIKEKMVDISETYKTDAEVIPENYVDIIDEYYPQKMQNCGQIMYYEFKYIATKLRILYPNEYKKCINARNKKIGKIYRNKYKNKKRQSFVNDLLNLGGFGANMYLNPVKTATDLVLGKQTSQIINSEETKKDKDSENNAYDIPRNNDNNTYDIPRNNDNNNVNKMIEDEMIDDNVENRYTKYDEDFYTLIYSQDLIEPLHISSKDPNIIRHTAKASWLCIKYQVISEIIQLFLHHVLTPLRQNNCQFRDAVDIGVEKQKLQEIIKQLSLVSKLSEFQLTSMIEKEMKRTDKHLARPIKELSIDDIRAVQNPEIKKLGDLKVQLLKDINKFKVDRMETEKILKNFD